MSPEQPKEHLSTQPQEPAVLLSKYGEYPSILQKVERSLTTGVVRVLFTDIDATFILGAGHRADEIERSLSDMRSLTAELNKLGFIIIPVTGSHLESATKTTGSVLERIERGILPAVGEHAEDRLFTVDAYVSDGGARAVCSVQHGTAVLDTSYSRRVTPENFNYEQVLAVALAEATAINQQALSAADFAVVSRYDKLAVAQRIHPQPGTQEGYHRKSNKVAFYFYASTLEDRDLLEARMNDVAAPLGLQVVCCEEKDATAAARRDPLVAGLLKTQQAPLKYCLDIVPFNKASAVRYFSDYIATCVSELAVQRGVMRPAMEVWACGDSGNDFPLMAEPNVSQVVVVGGASEELIRRAEHLTGSGKKVYIEGDSGRLGPASIAAALAESR